jgi:hypothetical protein
VDFSFTKKYREYFSKVFTGDLPILSDKPKEEGTQAIPSLLYVRSYGHNLFRYTMQPQGAITKQ